MSISFKQIVVAYDGSDEGKRAIEYGIYFKERIPESKLTIAHVYNERVEQRAVGNPGSAGLANDGYYIDPTQMHPVLPVENNYNRDAETHLVVSNSVTAAESHCLSILSENGVDGNFEILEGNPAESISSYAERIGADVIIVGNSGKSGIQKLFTGSTGSSIIKDASCPVLIAK
ncbi:Nucleotide-binding universal stress protein, UspA family [Bacillus sp. OV322]|uniref:universal stress protein n=1 Tax=Bacillus sp. OV322 TaxID=1882764 RepID=UPI0008E4BD7D|nr:universal stress protein [Bacillus sp. OV322]SFB94042.1 Nucleotide-binding universal stress protein, UspA family [Bacillus sp. OV322]